MRFSIIVPVYNIERYLDECINSVLCQNYSDYELILIDDGSTDNSGKICDKYASDNNKIRVIHKHNEGISATRNCGINKAHGEFIIFLDGDDYWEFNTMLSELSAYITEHNPDIIAFEGKIFRDDGNKKIINKEKVNKLSSKEDCYSFNNYIKAYLSKENLWGWYLWLYAFKKSIFNDTTLRFPKHRTYEDVYLTWRLLRKAKKIGTIPKPYYMYRQDRKGAITNTKTCKTISDFIWVIENNLHDVKQMDIEEPVKKLLMGNFSNDYFICCVMVGMIQKRERKKIIKELYEKKHLMEYVILPRYKYTARLSKVLGIRNLVWILSLRYRCKMHIKIRLLKAKSLKMHSFTI